MQPRFVGRLGLADAITVTNATIGFLAIAFAFVDVHAAARLILLAAILDGLDGVVARYRGGTPVGPYLDSLADVSSFAVAPAVLTFVVVREAWSWSGSPLFEQLVLFGVPALFVAMAIARLGIYTAYDTDCSTTVGAPTTLAATIIGAAVLAGVASPSVLLAVLVLFAYLMVSPITYPDLLARDALIMGVVHALAILFPDLYGRTFPYALLTLALAYLALSPWFYWGEYERSLRAAGSAKRKRS